jgi:hypothetical protein
LDTPEAAPDDVRNDAGTAGASPSDDVVPSAAGAGAASSSGDDSGTPANLPRGSVPAELVGIWQETRSSAGDYTDGFGTDLTLSSGFSIQLKLGTDGAYYLAHFVSGVTSDCATVTQFDQSVGTAVLDGTTLTLYPAQRRIDIQDCKEARSVDVEPDPIALEIGLSEDRQLYGGMRMYRLAAEGLRPRPVGGVERPIASIDTRH